MIILNKYLFKTGSGIGVEIEELKNIENSGNNLFIRKIETNCTKFCHCVALDPMLCQ